MRSTHGSTHRPASIAPCPSNLSGSPTQDDDTSIVYPVSGQDAARKASGNGSAIGSAESMDGAPSRTFLVGSASPMVADIGFELRF